MQSQGEIPREPFADSVPLNDPGDKSSNAVDELRAIKAPYLSTGAGFCLSPP